MNGRRSRWSQLLDTHREVLSSAKCGTMQLGRRIFKGPVTMAVRGIALIGILLTALWLEHRTEATLPTPTGPFVVGRTVYDWVDRKAQGALAPAPGNQRELLVWVWYPAEADAVLDDYLPLSCERRRVQIAGR